SDRSTAAAARAGRATRVHHPSATTPRGRIKAPAVSLVELPRDVPSADIAIGAHAVRLTNLGKVFWPALGLTKRDLLQYYADVAPALLPHLHDRAMVMKRYPDGAGGPFFFMMCAPSPRPDWIALCRIRHASGHVIDFTVVQ